MVAGGRKPELLLRSSLAVHSIKLNLKVAAACGQPPCFRKQSQQMPVAGYAQYLNEGEVKQGCDGGGLIRKTDDLD